MAHESRPSLKIFVIRHAERLDRALEKAATEQGTPLTTSQFLSFFAHPQNPPLSAEGRAMAKKVGGALAERGVSINRIYTSPLSRCVQTADLIADVLGLPQEKPCVLLEDALCEEACSMRFPRFPILPTRYEQLAISGRVDLEYSSLRPVFHEEMQNREWHVRDLEKMCPSDPEKRTLSGDPEIHCMRELCPALPNPFDPDQAQQYQEACQRLGLPLMKSNPGFEITLLRVRELLERLLPLDDEKGDTSLKKQKRDRSFVLVTHGAITTAVMAALTGERPTETTPVGTFYELHQTAPPTASHPLGHWTLFKK